MVVLCPSLLPDFLRANKYAPVIFVFGLASNGIIILYKYTEIIINYVLLRNRAVKESEQTIVPLVISAHTIHTAQYSFNIIQL